MKIHTTITLDEELVDKAKKKGLALSTTLNDLLRDSFGPKKIDKKEEEELQLIVQLAQQLQVSNNEAQKILETVDLCTTAVWESFERQFDPGYDIWRFIDMRKEVRELLAKRKEEKQ